MELSDLRARLAAGRLFHAYIVTGGSAGAREAAGRFIARAAVCSAPSGAPCGTCRDCVKAQRDVHPDIEFVDRTGREHSVDSMRGVRGRAAVMPNEAGHSVFVIREADAMNPQAQNAMLRILEDPPPHAVFILLADNPQRLLDTVRSRCETVNLAPERPAGPGGTEIPAAVLDAAAAGDNTALARALLPVEKLGREELPEFTAELRRLALARYAGGDLSADAVEGMAELLDKCDKMSAVNVSAAHIAGLLLAGLCRK